MVKRRLWLCVPLLIFVGVFCFLKQALNHDPHRIPSQLINQPLPKGILTNKDFKDRIVLLHVFASWCATCKMEHPLWMDIASEYPFTIVGLDYKDNKQEADEFLKKYGNPYQKIIRDEEGTMAVNLGVYGTPETFLIDKDGIVRYKHVGPMTLEVLKRVILPLISR